MLRRWHRLLAPFSAAILLIIATTGVIVQVTDLLDVRPPAAMAAPAGKKPGRTPLGEWNHWFKKIHSGEIVGGGGIAVNILGGLALTYFAGSGLWLWFDPWWRKQRRKRARR